LIDMHFQISKGTMPLPAFSDRRRALGGADDHDGTIGQR